MTHIHEVIHPYVFIVGSLKQFTYLKVMFIGSSILLSAIFKFLLSNTNIKNALFATQFINRLVGLDGEPRLAT